MLPIDHTNLASLVTEQTRCAPEAAYLRSGAYRVFTRKRVFLVKSSETRSARSAPRKNVDLSKTVQELRERPQELVADISRGDPQVGGDKISSCHERHRANRHDGKGSP